VSSLNLVKICHHRQIMRQRKRILGFVIEDLRIRQRFQTSLVLRVETTYLLHKSCDGKMTQKIPWNIVAGFDSSITWGEYHGQWRFSGEAKFICGPSESTGGETFTTLANQRVTKTCVFSK
jgi:hypothetical protein